MNLSHHQGRVNVDQFSMVPRADIPRARFTTSHTHKTTFDGGYLYPILVEEVLPGDHFSGRMTVFARMQTLLFPLMDHLTLESFFFFDPARLVWPNWKKMMGERTNPADSIAYLVPRCLSPVNGFAVNDIGDYMGLPMVGQVNGGAQVYVNALQLRAYNHIWNEWFRDENLQNTVSVPTDDGPDAPGLYTLLRRNKRHDYITSALPWPLKNNDVVTMPLSGTAPVLGIGKGNNVFGLAGQGVLETGTGATTFPFAAAIDPAVAAGVAYIEGVAATGNPAIYADLSQATGATISALRLAVQTQRLLERDARSGTRYTELLRSHFGVTPEDSRLQRPEYIGGGRSPVQTQAIPQTSATGLTGGSSPLGALGGASTATGQHRFQYSATEHGYIIGLIHVDAELTYQQGLHRQWTRQTRYDYYWPVFAHLSEQGIRTDELYVTGTGNDTAIFGYQERWAEYRHRPSRISGLFRSTSAGTIDTWHSAQKFTGVPTLASTFIASTPPFARNLTAGSAANGMQFLADLLFDIDTTRAMPIRSVPGGMDRF